MWMQPHLQSYAPTRVHRCVPARRRVGLAGCRIALTLQWQVEFGRLPRGRLPRAVQEMVGTAAETAPLRRNAPRGARPLQTLEEEALSIALGAGRVRRRQAAASPAPPRSQRAGRVGRAATPCAPAVVHPVYSDGAADCPVSLLDSDEEAEAGAQDAQSLRTPAAAFVAEAESGTAVYTPFGHGVLQRVE